ncbi:MAG TPA: undecaprenyl-diphosphate phosphatase [Streptosporangiaceae bacterium]
MSYLQAVVIALIQGVTELFPVSSLGHSVLVPAWLGGSWQTMVTQSSQQSSESSFYLAYIVALHCATALALMWFFRADWVRLIRGFFRSLGRSLRQRRLSVTDKDERLAWMIIFATIPVGLTGVLLEHTFRTVFAKPAAAAILLFVNGLVLAGAEAMRRVKIRRGGEVAGASAVSVPSPAPAMSVGGPALAAAAAVPGSQAQPARPHSHRKSAGGRARDEIDAAEQSDERIAGLSYGDGIIIGTFQIAALLAGISRSGIAMAGGLWRGLDHEDAARFAFLLATPVILAAGVLKVPSLLGSAGAHIHGQVVVGVIVTAISAYLSVRFLVRYFQTRTLTPFAIYCLVFGAASVVHFAF